MAEIERLLQGRYASSGSGDLGFDSNDLVLVLSGVFDFTLSQRYSYSINQLSSHTIRDVRSYLARVISKTLSMVSPYCHGVGGMVFKTDGQSARSSFL